MKERKFSDVAALEKHSKWEQFIKREKVLYQRTDDIRSDFYRDFNRILHCNAYRRLKHKTQVFFATRNDHICTRIEHVNHVNSVSYTICKQLGLNTELSSAIAIGHDIGHAPFGHQGEKVLKEIMFDSNGERFWHEKNSLWFIDKIETLTGPDGKEHNLNLTYAVRDGIVSHCGEVDENAIFPRESYIKLEDISEPNQYQPFTWEGCIVKIADKISYLGRDIEDAITLHVLSLPQLRELKKIIKQTMGDLPLNELNNTVIIHSLITDLCTNSSPKVGINLSPRYLELINSIKKFNYDYIYLHGRLNPFKKYAELIIRSIYELLLNFYDGKDTISKINRYSKVYPITQQYFSGWLMKYSDIGMDISCNARKYYNNEVIYNIDNKEHYKRAIIDYISGMTDSFAIKTFMEITSF